ncbi:hypothetical protein BJY52DRAFT_1322096 [Lactarius psammicola]|nr:hypothetical protein BJY52DRAFT_1322096 [Lactarius psammicola]
MPFGLSVAWFGFYFGSTFFCAPREGSVLHWHVANPCCSSQVISTRQHEMTNGTVGPASCHLVDAQSAQRWEPPKA